MNFSNQLEALASSVLCAFAAAVIIDGAEYHKGTDAKVYPDGLPKKLISCVVELKESAHGGLQKRANAGVYSLLRGYLMRS